MTQPSSLRVIPTLTEVLDEEAWRREPVPSLDLGSCAEEVLMEQPEALPEILAAPTAPVAPAMPIDVAMDLALDRLMKEAFPAAFETVFERFAPVIAQSLRDELRPSLERLLRESNSGPESS